MNDKARETGKEASSYWDAQAAPYYLRPLIRSVRSTSMKVANDDSWEFTSR